MVMKDGDEYVEIIRELILCDLYLIFTNKLASP